MFNPFKKTEAPKLENIEELPSEKPEALEVEEKLDDSEPIDVRLEALTDYFDQCEKHGIEMTKEMVETEIRDRLGIEIDDLLGEQISDPELQLTHQELVSRINELMSQKAEEKGTPLSFLRDKFKSKFARLAVMTALMLLKFNPLHAADHKDTKENIKDKIEHDTKKPVNHDGDGDKTFKASFEDFNGKVVISATNNFETDKADIHNADNLKADFDKFLSSIDKTNFNDLIGQDWIVKGSSDERKTSRPGGNPVLTHDRIAAVKTILEEALASHSFANKLSVEQIKQISEKQIKEVYPTSGAEEGVTHLTDLVNPITGHNFTDAEVKSIKESNPSEYHKLLDQCRYTNFELAVKKSVPVVEKIEPVKPPKVELPVKTPDHPKIFIKKNFDKYYLLVDDSPSMSGTKKNMAKELSTLDVDKPFMVANFSENLSKISYEKNSEKAAKKMMRMDTDHSSSTELSMSSAIKFLETIEKQEDKQIKNNEVLPRGIMYVATDETLQDVNQLQKLTELSAKTNTEIEFLVFYGQGNKVLKLSLDDIQKQMDKNNLLKVGNRLVIKKLADSNGKVIVSR